MPKLVAEGDLPCPHFAEGRTYGHILILEGLVVKRHLLVLIGESERSRFLRDLITPRRRIRHVAREQECLDLAYSGTGDVMLLDIEDASFSDSEFISRIRFVSRNAFPILGVASLHLKEPEKWLRAGLSEILYREMLTPFLLDRALRHWVKHHRLQMRLFDANRRALGWWKHLVSALDEVRTRMEKNVDSLDAYLTLLGAGEGEIPSLRRQTLSNACKQVAEISHLAQELDVAARTIQLEGMEKTKRQPSKPGSGLFTASALIESALADERNCLIDPPTSYDPEEHKRYGT